MINVGLIGFGLAGRAFHAQVISHTPGLRLAAILQRTGDEAAMAYPDAKIVRSLDELLALPDIRLIVIATPNETHAPFARAALASGHDVVVDKPFTTSYAEAAELVNFAEKSGRFLTVYQNRRYDGDFQAIRELVAAGTLGRIVRFETHYDRFRPNFKPNAWREKAGARRRNSFRYRTARHRSRDGSFRQARSRYCRRAHRAARRTCRRCVRHRVSLSWRLRAVLSSSILAAVQRPRFLLFGTKGAFVKQTVDPQENNLRFGKLPAKSVRGAPSPSKTGACLRCRTARTRRSAVFRRAAATIAIFTRTFATCSKAKQNRL